MNKKKIVFLDRDGVINKEKKYLYKVKDFEFINGVFESLNYLKRLGFEFVIISNQSGIGRGYYSLDEFNNLNQWMLKEFKRKEINILDVLICPHTDGDNCYCRKPKPGLFVEAIKKHNINANKSFVVGDAERDILAAKESGVKTKILVRSGHPIDEINTQSDFILNSIKDISTIIR